MNLKNKNIAFLKSKILYPFFAALGAGLYPLFFYFTNNYTMVNTWGHVKFFIKLFLVLPVLVFVGVYLISQFKTFEKIRKYILPFLGTFAFLSLLRLCLYGEFSYWAGLLILVLAGLFAFYLHKHFRKLLIFQWLLAVIGLFTLIPTLFQQMQFPTEWNKQPDAIAEVTLKKKPNVYFIQPDGYVNFTQLKKGYYGVEETELEDFLVDEGFTNYDDFRSNYISTLTSNSATFNMKHHYFNKGIGLGEILNSRDFIVSQNPVLDIFKNNGYTTNLVVETPYLLMSRPKLGFDYCNYKFEDINYMGTGLNEEVDVVPPLEERLENKGNDPQFFFIEILNPSHIATWKNEGEGVEKEKEKWLKKLEVANRKVKEIVSVINEKDPDALVVIMADHGGYVGYKYMREIYIKTEDEALLNSAYSIQLSIRWPEGITRQDDQLKTPVNLFRCLFSSLSEDTVYLEHLEEDESFAIIDKGARRGVYKYIDENGDFVFEKVK
ncbi:hypothetical protein POV27_10365 [Aureisphaera galaxeae]|uniref:sulfatase-like hydrolase/transferase n=1 Tax=Aureisphaera galaxeae TaxID=1538023 RepID=UPI00235041B8|nr:sulfatase-like hydrolase/transferase [Aureisphaera galaxeae]MDC8004455.1 hypothetical protein [Aureisphaera galaxeae]